MILSSFHAPRIRNLLGGGLHPSRRINHTSERARKLNFALASITRARPISRSRSVSSTFEQAFPSLGGEPRLSISPFLQNWVSSANGARPRCPARIGRFTCHLRRNERERTIAAGEKGKDERASIRRHPGRPESRRERTLGERERETHRLLRSRFSFVAD